MKKANKLLPIVSIIHIYEKLAALMFLTSINSDDMFCFCIPLQQGNYIDVENFELEKKKNLFVRSIVFTRWSHVLSFTLPLNSYHSYPPTHYSTP